MDQRVRLGSTITPLVSCPVSQPSLPNSSKVQYTSKSDRHVSWSNIAGSPIYPAPQAPPPLSHYFRPTPNERHAQDLSDQPRSPSAKSCYTSFCRMKPTFTHLRGERPPPRRQQNLAISVHPDRFVNQRVLQSTWKRVSIIIRPERNGSQNRQLTVWPYKHQREQELCSL